MRLAAADPSLARLARSFGLTLAISTGIALLLTAVYRGVWLHHAAYAYGIGLGCWACCEVGRRVAARLAGVPGRFPGWRWYAPALAVGVAAGTALGVEVADRLTGRSMTNLLDWSAPSTQGTLVLAVLGTAVIASLMAALERAAAARVEAEAARRLAAETRLKLLESQLEPHMLFNTLANLRALIALDPPRAQAMLDRLIAFLRATLAASQASLHPLQAEFARLDDYLALMAVRMGTRLQVQTALPQDLRDRPVPVLLLQPLVENAIQHGLEPRVEGGRLEVAARAEGGRLELTVRDTGVGLDRARASGGAGFGCRQVRDRLATLYGSAAELSVEPASGGGTLARIRMPLEGPTA
jgi:signal transduction histidine kinase